MALKQPESRPMVAGPGTPLDELSTPLPLIDETRLAANIQRVQAYMDEHGLAFRPHIKTHKIPAVAAQQVKAGAKGINCQKVSEAEIFADAGFNDILITFNIMGPEKLEHLVRLNQKVSDLKVTADNAATVAGLAASFSPDCPLKVLVECDTGGGRCGVQTPEDACTLAQMIQNAEGLTFAGILTYPAANSAQAVEAFFAETIQRLTQKDMDCPIVSNGGTPSLFEAHLVPSATEHRAGTYAYNDRAMVRAGHCSLDECAMHILATVVSRPTPDRAIIDAGSKALTSDLLGFSDYGHIVEYPGARVSGLSEEHGTVDLSGCPQDARPDIGERIRIVPNHTCVVSNLTDVMTFHKDGKVTRTEPVAARGRVW
jgi:D-serine deaminase-like pyridoxal phosphate-dependent protein